MYSVSSAFASIASRKNAEWLRSFMIGTSDYAQHVVKWPSFEKKWDDLRPLTPSIECQNEDGTFNFFMLNPALMRSAASLKIGLFIETGFAALGQTSRNWFGMASLGSDVYAAVNGGDIYKQTGGTGDFIALGQTSRSWRGMTSLGSDVYAAVYGGDIYKQTSGSGDFIALGQTSRSWYGMASNGSDVYASEYGGDIYKQTSGSGDFIALGQTSRGWVGMASLGSDVYAVVYSGGIYKQTGGTGDFISLGQTSRSWHFIISNGSDVYAGVDGGDIYKQTGGTGDFVALEQTSRSWHGMASLGSDVYAGVYGGDIYKYSPGSGDDEWLTIFDGTLDAIQYSGGGAGVTLVDKFKQLADRKIGDTTVPVAYTSSAHFIHDMAWYLCTSHGGLSATANSSNPDLNYTSFTSWSAAFSADNVRTSANFTGQTPLEGLKKLAVLTQSAIFIQGGKITFQRFSLVGADAAILTNDNTIDVRATLDDRMLVNKSYVSGDYDVSSRKFNITTLAIGSASVNSYGPREKLVAESFVWLTDSVSTLNLCQRTLQTQGVVKPRYVVKSPLDNVAITIGDTLGFIDEQLGVNNSFRVMGETLDMDNGAKSWALDQTQYLGAFTLDVSALDGADILT